MKTTERRTAVGVFDNRTQAEKAIEELRQAGFRKDQVGVAVRPGDLTEPPAEETNMTTEAAAESVIAGVFTGGTLGALVGALAAGLMPGVGWVVAGGLLAGITSGAVLGATTGGLFGVLIGLGLPEEEAGFYEKEFLAGRTIVTVQVEGRWADAAEILRRHGAYDINTVPAAAGTA